MHPGMVDASLRRSTVARLLPGTNLNRTSPELVADICDQLALLNQQRRKCVPQIVNANLMEIRLRERRLKHPTPQVVAVEGSPSRLWKIHCVSARPCGGRPRAASRTGDSARWCPRARSARRAFGQWHASVQKPISRAWDAHGTRSLA